MIFIFTVFAVLEVVAVDQGSPGLSTSVLVNIAVEDSNDNAPVFPEGNYTVYVQEDKPYGHILLRFSVTDSDDSPNGAPFTWSVATAHCTIQRILRPPPGLPLTNINRCSHNDVTVPLYRDIV